MSTLQNGTLITFYEHYKINLETAGRKKKGKSLGFDLVCLFQLAVKSEKKGFAGKSVT